MDITKEQARKLIENKILTNQRLPIYDEIIYIVISDSEIKEYSFRGLLKYVYDLK
jgi:hypothetical protein